jgi:hypothetical protein
MEVNFDQVREGAREIRAAFERGQVPKELLARLYLEYNPDIPRIDEFLDAAAEIFPLGNCGIASVYLRHQFGMGDVHHGHFEQTGHTFLKLGNLTVGNSVVIENSIIDITADQFGGPVVYVGTLQLPWSEK